ncbi:385_t:CDS:2 [Cetraspora pellucida]|uniref:385_t:CDS:1 n=1 Tax=Cetraspora pellucida TaxID=1433469 RepID=A0A9N9HSU9_9GLOM|nr:385_t:CDS:2 [Cetraspora pellucida]
MDISNIGLKQELINKLISKCKTKKELYNSLFRKKVVNLKDDGDKKAGSHLHKCDSLAGVDNSNNKLEMNSFRAGGLKRAYIIRGASENR